MQKKTRYLTESELSVQEREKSERIVSAKAMHNTYPQMPCGGRKHDIDHSAKPKWTYMYSTLRT